jgi:LysM repeat protein
MVTAARGGIVGIAAVMMACSSRTPAPAPAPVETRDAGASAEADASASASATADADADAGVTEDALVAYLRKSVPRGGEVGGGESVKITHTVASGDTYPAIAASYLELTEIYTVGELARAIEKKNSALVTGARIAIPSVITRVPREPREERLGFPEDKALRALFMTGPFVAQKWVESLDKMAARGINAVILDAKDYQGPVTYPTKAKIAVEIGAAAKPSIPDLARAIRFAHWRGIRVSLRIPCFHDPMADKKAKDGRLSLKSATTGQPVHIDWLDPTNVEAQDYAIEIAKEGVLAGADEINLDYVRFPVHITERFAKRVHAETKPAGVALSLDLFGVAATGSRFDIDRLGQEIAVVGPEAEVIMPMVYPSHYDKGYNGWEHPGDHPEIVGMGTKAAVAQLKAAKADTVVRAWLQAFSWRTSIFGTKYVVDQANSAEKNGGTGWAMWSPACEYTAVYNGFPVKAVKEKPAVVAGK